MNLIVNRAVRNCFSIFIPLSPVEEMEVLIKASMIVDQATTLMLQGKICPEEFLEIVDPFIEDMDQYVREIETNLDAIYLGD